AEILFADPEHHGVDEAEGMVEHQPLHLAIGGAAPMAAGQKGPADLDFALGWLVVVIAAGADQPVARAVDKDESLLRCDAPLKQFSGTPARCSGPALDAPSRFPDRRQPRTIAGSR